MSNEFNVAVKVSADASQLTAELKRAGGALQEFTAQAQGGSAGVTGALQSTTTAAQAMGAAVHSGAQAQVAGAQSAAQHADALRGAAAQITNTVTTLGGLTQQGAQAGASLGTTTGAVRALFTAAGVATTGLGALAVAGGALITAYARGSAETDAYRLAIVRTGNAAGTSVDQLADYARQIASVSGTQAQAAETLGIFTASGAVGTGMLREAAQAAIEWERATGQAASTTAAKFAALARDPLAATVKLNEGMNFLTASTYQQIKALQEQGRTSDAAAAAQHALADALTTRAGEIEANLGTIERGWRGVKDMAASAWDAMLNIGREGTRSDRLQALKAELAQHQAAQAMDTRGLGMESSASVMARRGQSERAEQIKNEIAALEAEIGTEQALAKVQADGAANRKLYFEWEKQGDALRTKAQQRDHAIRSAEAEGQVLLNAGLITEAQLRERIDAIREKYKDRKGAGGPKGADSELASLQAQLQAAQLYGEQLSTLGTAASALNAGERASLKIGEELKQVTDDKTAARLREKQAIADALGAQLRSNDGLQESLKAHQAGIDANYADADAIEQRAKAQEAANATLGKSKTAIEEMTLAELKHQMAEAQGSDSFDPKYIASLERKIAAQERWVTALRGADYKAAEQHVNELLRGAEELSRAYADEQQLSGLTALEREKITAQRQVELKYAKELAAIDKMALSDAEKQTLREIALQAKRKEGIAAVAKAQQQAGARAADEINRSLTDALMRGFESGKGFAQNLADTTRNLFNSMVLRPVISAIMTPVSLVVSGIVQQGLGAVGLGSGPGSNLLGMASTASNAYSMYGALNGQGLLGGIGSTLFGNAAVYGAAVPGLTMGGSQAAMLAAQTGEFGLAGLSATSSAASGAAGAGGGFMSGIGAALPWLAGGLLLGNALGLFRTTEKRGAGLIGTLGEEGGVHDADLMRKSGTLFGGPDWFVEDRGKSALDKAVQQSFDASKTAIKGFAQSLGLATDQIDGFKSALGTETLGDHGQLGIRLDNNGQPLSDAEVQAKITAAIKNADNQLAEQLIGTWQETTREVTETVKTGFWDDLKETTRTRTVTDRTYTPSEFARDGEQAIDTLTRLGTSIAAVNTTFETLGMALLDASLAGGAAASSFIDLFGTLDNFNAAVGTYYQNFYSGDERRQKQKADIDKMFNEYGLASIDMDAVDARAQYRALVEREQGRMIDEEAAKQALKQTFKDGLSGLPDLADMSGQALDDALRAALGPGEQISEEAQGKLKGLFADFDAGKLNIDQLSGSVADLVAPITGTGKSAAETTAALLQASGAFAAVTTSAEDAAAVQTAAHKSATDAAWRTMQQSIAAAREAAQAEITLRQQRLQTAQAIVELTRDQARELRGLVDSTVAMTAREANAFIDSALTAARSGQLPEAESLRQAITDARAGMDTSAYGNRLDYEAAQLILANKLDAIGDSGQAQVDVNELLLEQAKKEVDRLDMLIKAGQAALDEARGNTAAVRDVESAVKAFYDRLFEEQNSNEVVGGGAFAGGAAPTFGPGDSTGAPGAPAKYRTPVYLGTAGVGYQNVTDPERIARLDKYDEGYHAFDGTGDAAGLAQYIVDNGLKPEDMSAMSGLYENDWARWYREQGIPGYAGGGSFAGGLRLVGEDGPELEVTGPARIYNAGQTQQLLAALQGGGNAEVVAAVQALQRQGYDIGRTLIVLLQSVETLARKQDAIGVLQREGAAP